MIAKKKLYLPFIATCILASRLSAYGQAVETFKDVLSFVDQHSKLVVLSNASGASVAVWPQEQGRILTSAISPEGQSFGWVNRELIASGKVRAHINALGGEDRLWLGPEGGQYSLFFAPGSKFDLDHWFTPAAFDTEAFTVAGQTRDSIAMTKEVELTNYSGTHFKVLVQRKVHLLPAEKVWQDLGLTPVKGIRMVAYQSDNKLTNLAAQAMEKKTGVLSLWVLGQFNAAPAATIVLPFRPGDEAELGVPVKTDYFGPVPADRIRVGSNVAFFKADAGYRSKLGVNPRRSRGNHRQLRSGTPLAHHRAIRSTTAGRLCELCLGNTERALSRRCSELL